MGTVNMHRVNIKNKKIIDDYNHTKANMGHKVFNLRDLRDC